MSAIISHYRNVQQLLRSQSASNASQRESKWEKENIDRGELVAVLVEQVGSAQGLQEAAA